MDFFCSGSDSHQLLAHCLHVSLALDGRKVTQLRQKQCTRLRQTLQNLCRDEAAWILPH